MFTHAPRICIEEHWSDEDFVAFKVDMKNAFNAVSRQVVVEECTTFSHRTSALGVLVLWVTSSVMVSSMTNQFRVSGSTGGSPGPLTFCTGLAETNFQCGC